MPKLSEHFTLEELIQSQTADRRKIDNTPDGAVIANLRLVCENILEPVRAHYGVAITPNSGYRSPKLNIAVGGSKTSPHVKGEAVDFVVPGVRVPDVCEWIKDNLEFDQLIQEFWNPSRGTGWVHCSYRKGRNRKQFLKIG